MIHHLFKALPASFKKNKAWKKNVVDIEDVVHQHFFHTINSMGMEQKYTTATGGHFHEIKVIPQGNGQPPRVECGPALTKVTRRLPNGSTKSFNAAISWEYINQNGELAVLKDEHKHDMVYGGSDEIFPNHKLNQQAQAAIQNSNKSSWENEEVRLDVVPG
jgi:hypothetical protein